MTREFVIVGAGGHAREIDAAIAACVADGQDMKSLGFVVDDEFRPEVPALVSGRILGNLDWLASKADSVFVIIGIGSPESRFQVARRLATSRIRFGTIVHPDSVLSSSVTIGQGSVVLAGCRLTVDIQLGMHVHLSQGCIVGHDSVIEEFASVYPGAILSGHTRVGEGALIGAGSTIVERLKVGAWSRIGAGSTVLEDVDVNSTAVGVPARVVRRRHDGWQQAPRAIP